MRSRTSGVRAAGCACAFALAMSGCIITGDDCGPNQVPVGDYLAVCVCAPDFVSDAAGTGCVPCGENQTAAQNKCVCKQGFARAGATDACLPAREQLTCESDATCSSAEPYCVRGASEGGYCTRVGCSVNADCDFGWSCEMGESGRYCARPPRGRGNTCESDADCASFDARYCDTLLSHTCLLADCATRGTTCPNEWSCCDYASLLGRPLSICVEPTQLVSNGCPQSGTKVTF